MLSRFKKMHFIYIITIIILVTYSIYTSHQHVLKNINLKKEIDSLITSKTNLLLIIESFHTQDNERENTIASLTSELNSSQEQIYALEYAVKENKLKHEKQLAEAISIARKDSIKRSRSVLRGQATEHLAPYILKNTNPKDYRFLGNPIDYVCFEGLSDILDGTSDNIKSIHFIDIKTGKSTLNKTQRRIRDAIKDSRVQFSLINLDKEIEKQDDTIKEESSTSSIEESKN